MKNQEKVLFQPLLEEYETFRKIKRIDIELEKIEDSLPPILQLEDHHLKF